MKQVKDYPPNIEKIRAAFDIQPNTVFTYGDTLYNPMGGFIDEPLEVHEHTHTIQQESMGVEQWWEQYLIDPKFRSEQELEAYQNQYKKASTMYNRGQLFFYGRILATDLSSAMYGKCISFTDAFLKITKGV